jgi:hypothetical protein
MENNNYELNYTPDPQIALFLTQKTLEGYMTTGKYKYNGKTYQNPNG